MEVIIEPDGATVARLVARILARRIEQKPHCVLGLATGKTMERVYEELVRLHREEGLDFSLVHTFNLDEYLGLQGDHPCSYRHFMEEKLFRHVNIQPERIFTPDGMARDVPAECAAYEERIRQCGGIDVQLLGVGSDGHIGFNEPTSSLGSRTRIKTLTERTRRDNSCLFGSEDKVPKHCITMGVGTILEARCILLLAFGGEKAGIIAKAVEGPVTAMVPASILQMHPEVKVFVDEQAAAGLEHARYYRWAYAHKPEWQKS